MGEQSESVNIEHGLRAHARVDQRLDDRADVRRGLDVASEVYGLTGRCDVVRQAAGGLQVTEFKSAPGRRSVEVTEAQQVQLALQGICLREAGHEVSSYAVHFTSSRRTVDVRVDADLQRRALDYVKLTRQVVNSTEAPLPLTDDPRCSRCSHYNICLPDERDAHLPRRRIRVLNPDRHVVHLTQAGSRARLTKGRVVVHRGDDELASLPVASVLALVCHGNVDLSSGVVRELLWRSVPVLWCSSRGALVGWAVSGRSPNGLPRHRQHLRAAAGDLLLAREMIAAKVANQATQLRRSARTDVEGAVRRLRAVQARLPEADSLTEVFGLEGEAAAEYFGSFGSMFSPAAEEFRAAWPGRVGRGAGDPVNVALNVAYGALAADMVRAVVACGLDPHAGFLHSPGRNKPALALDLMEQFRPVVADSVVLTAINNGELRATMFTRALGDWRLRDTGRRALLAAYERRVAQEFTHPVFGYRVTWRRAMEVQARMVLGVIDGSQTKYRGIRVR